MNDTGIEADDIKAVVRDHWSRRARDFDEGPTHGLHSEEQRRAWLSVLTRLAGRAGDRPLDVLDLGCGTGFLSLLLAELGHRVDGVDLAPAMLDIARAKAEAARLPVRFREGDAEAPPGPDAGYDLVVERHLIWTLPRPDAALAEWRRVLRPGGRVALVEGDWRDRAVRQPDYEPIAASLPLYGGSRADGIARRLEAAGFRDIAVEPLSAEVLWGEEAARERFLISGRRP